MLSLVLSSRSSASIAARKTIVTNFRWLWIKLKGDSTPTTDNYMDNYTDSFPSIFEARKGCEDLSTILKRGSFILNEWASNSRELLSIFPAADLAVPFLNLEEESLPTGRMLGLFLDPNEDVSFTAFEFVQKPIRRGRFYVRSQVKATHLGLYCPSPFRLALSFRKFGCQEVAGTNQ